LPNTRKPPSSAEDGARPDVSPDRKATPPAADILRFPQPRSGSPAASWAPPEPPRAA